VAKLHAILTSVVSLFHVPATLLPIEFEAVWTLEPNLTFVGNLTSTASNPAHSPVSVVIWLPRLLHDKHRLSQMRQSVFANFPASLSLMFTDDTDLLFEPQSQMTTVRRQSQSGYSTETVAK